MNATPEEMQAAAPDVDAFRMIRTLVGVAMISGILIVAAVEVTEDRITENKRRALEAAIHEVIPEYASRRVFETGPDGFALVPLEDETSLDRRKVYAYVGYGPDGGLAGIAFDARGQGYQDEIRILYGYSPEKQCIVGMTVLENKETPGLGDKIKKNPFRENFLALDVHLNEEGSALANPIEAVKHGKKEQPWEIDGITGATISSVAIADMLDRSAQKLIPLTAKYLEQFTKDER